MTLRTVDTLRVTPELREVVDKCAAHTGLTVSEICRAVACGIRRGRLVKQIQIEECYTNSGTEIIGVRGGVEIPDMCTEKRFRKVLYIRCMEELAKPPKAPLRVVAVLGVDYIAESVR